ncbi:helix-turn-helix domain-containing protein [Bradyrhizobium sp. CNPSo 4026]|nr:helix-turn-helix domain-containing protein [Bradyrhizobium cenepequi]
MTAPAGVVTVRTGGRPFVIAGKKGVWVPEGTPHEVVASTEVKLRNLQVSRELGPDLPTSVCPITVSPLFSELLHSAVQGRQWFASGSREAKVLDLLVLEFMPADDVVFNVPEPRDTRLRRICAELQKNPSDNKSLAEWADTAGGCTRTLERLFKKETGLTFAQWRRQVRIQDAIVRLHLGQSVTSVAYDAGYENTSSFIEMFRRVTGRTPGQFLDA